MKKMSVKSYLTLIVQEFRTSAKDFDDFLIFENPEDAVRATIERMKIDYEFNIQYAKPIPSYQELYDNMIEGMETVTYEEHEYTIVRATFAKNIH